MIFECNIRRQQNVTLWLAIAGKPQRNICQTSACSSFVSVPFRGFLLRKSVDSPQSIINCHDHFLTGPILQIKSIDCFCVSHRLHRRPPTFPVPTVIFKFARISSHALTPFRSYIIFQHTRVRLSSTSTLFLFVTIETLLVNSSTILNILYLLRTSNRAAHIGEPTRSVSCTLSSLLLPCLFSLFLRLFRNTSVFSVFNLSTEPQAVVMTNCREEGQDDDTHQWHACKESK